MSLPVKTNPDEICPPTISAEVRNWKGSPHLTVVFNKDRKHFDHDVLFIKLGKEEAVISRDDLASVIVNGHEQTKQYEEHLREEGIELRKQGIL